MCEAFAGEKNLKYIAAKPQDWVSKGYKPFAGERPERNSPSRVSFPVNSNKFALPQREGGILLQQTYAITVKRRFTTTTHPHPSACPTK